MGVYGRAALLPSKDQYISTYAGLPIEQKEKFLADANKRFYENIGTTGKIGAAIAQLDLLDKDNPLREEWKTKIDDHIKGVADNEGAWENAGFDTAMMAATFASDDSVQLGLRNKVDYKGYLKGLNDRLSRGNITQTQFDYYKDSPFTTYEGASASDSIAKHFGTPAESVNIQDKIAQFKQIKEADFVSSGWEWNEDKKYYEKSNGEVMDPNQIKGELREWLMADPLTRDFVNEMETLDPSYVGQLEKTINGAAEAMGYTKWSHDIKFQPNYGKGKSTGTNVSAKYATASVDQLVTDTATQVTTPADYYLTQAKGNDKMEILEKANVANITNFSGRVENYQDEEGQNNYYIAQGPEDPYSQIIDKRTDMPVSIDTLPVALREARAIYIAEHSNIKLNKQIVTEREYADKQMYDVATNSVDQKFRQALGEEPPSKENIQTYIEEYEKDSRMEHTADAIIAKADDSQENIVGFQGQIAVGASKRLRKPTVLAALNSGSEKYDHYLTSDDYEEIDQEVRFDLEDSDQTAGWMSRRYGRNTGAYFKMLDKEVKDKFGGATERVQTANIFVNPGSSQVKEIATVAQAMIGTGTNAAKYIQTHAVEWYGTALNEDGDPFAVSADQLQDIQANGQMDIESWVFDKRDGKMKAIFRVTANEGGVLGFFEDQEQRRIAIELPADFEQRLIADVAYKELSNPQFNGVSSSVRSMIRAKLFQSYKAKLDTGLKTRQGTKSGNVRDATFDHNTTSTFQTSIGNISVQYVPGVSKGPVPRTPKYIISAYDKASGKNRSFEPYDNEESAIDVIYSLLQQAGQFQAIQQSELNAAKETN